MIEGSMRRLVMISVLLAGLTVIVFHSVAQCDFVNYDDPDYMTENSMVQKGLSWEGVRWAFTNLHGARTYWHPVTWLSHMLDVQLFGLNPRAHHLVNLLFHTVNVVFLFILLNRLTGAIWRSAIVAAIFAVHPLQVESVAWIAERKNTLSGLFWILSILAYHAYVVRKCLLWYVLSLACFGIGLMCKPVLVTLPVILLLLDYWPLHRTSFEPAALSKLKGLLIEKLPFFGLALASGALTIWAHQELKLLYGERLSLWLRIQNAIVSYARYLGKALWPHDLAVLYPHPGVWSAWSVAFSLLVVAVLATCALICIKRRPALFVGWFWFALVLVPTIGVLQAGVQAMADRFTYLPLIGLSLAAIWGATECTERLLRSQLAKICITSIALAALAAMSVRQLSYWRNSILLWTHTIAVTPQNYIAHNNLGSALFAVGQRESAKEQAIESLRIVPNFARARCLLGQILSDEGRLDDAIVQFQAAAQFDPNWVDVPLYLARSLSAEGKTAAAASEYRKALAIEPDSLVALNNLAWILAASSDPSLRNGSEAVRLSGRACELTAYRVPVYIGTLAAALAENNEFEKAVSMAKRARDEAERIGDEELLRKNEELMSLFKSGKAVRQP